MVDEDNASFDEKIRNKKKLPYGEYLERVVTRKKKGSHREERPQFESKED